MTALLLILFGFYLIVLQFQIAWRRSKDRNYVCPVCGTKRKRG